jgi:hypothetical protein
MAEGFMAAEFLASDPSEWVKQARRLANAAGVLAGNAPSPVERAGYLELKRQWNMLADEIEREEQSKRGLSGVAAQWRRVEAGLGWAGVFGMSTVGRRDGIQS